MKGLLIVVFSLIASVALSHDDAGHSNWIMERAIRHPLSGVHCCGKDDCRITDAVKVTTKGYWLTDTNEVVPFAHAVINDHDDHYWRCDRRDHIGFAGIRCLIVPPQNM